MLIKFATNPALSTLPKGGGAVAAGGITRVFSHLEMTGTCRLTFWGIRLLLKDFPYICRPILKDFRGVKAVQIPRNQVPSPCKVY